MRPVIVADLGTMAYEPVWARQRSIVESKKAGSQDDHLLLVEHEPVITLGRRADPANVLADRARLAALGVQVHAVERGGDVTYHGPGQLVAYPILDLSHFRRDVRWYADTLMRAVVTTLGEFGVVAESRWGRETGVWLGGGSDGGASGKLAAFGVRIERWITYHGIALNVCTDLADFALIVPCGLPGARVTSMAEALGRPVSMEEARTAFVRAFCAAFGAEPIAAPLESAMAPTARARARPPAIDR